MRTLPIDPLLPDIVRAVRDAGALVLEAEPGAGKTTRVPAALLDAGVCSGEIWVSEPRRLAARLAARFVAHERGERVGESVGYSVRFEDVSSARTRIRYVTEGVLVRRLLGDSDLKGVGAVVIDELHERSLDTDLALALVQRLRRSRRPELALVAMSATLHAAPVQAFLGDCPRLASEGRVFPVTVEHERTVDDRPLEKRVASAVKTALADEVDGHVLVFLPGAREIRRAADALAPFARQAGVQLLPLHGDLDMEAQARAVEPSSTRKVVLSTNVAESSVTIDGVTAVVDSGLVRRASASPWTGLSRLEVEKISRASAVQRAGRAGRTRPGRVFRLFTVGDFQSRPEFETPEIERLDLTELSLVLAGSGVREPHAIPWLTAPPRASLDAAAALLARLGAIDARGDLTKIGRRLLELPLHPRLARVVQAGEERGVGRAAACVASLLSEREIRADLRTRFGDGSTVDAERGPCDVLERLERFEQAAEARFDSHALRSLSLDARSVRAVDRAARQIARKVARDRVDSVEDRDVLLRKCLLDAYVDRLARRPRPGGRDLILQSGTTAKLAEESVVVDATFLLAVDVEQRGTQTTVRLATAIEAEWLLEQHPALVRDETALELNPKNGRVERVGRLSVGSVVLDEVRRPAEPSPEASALLLKAALAQGAERWAASSGLSALVARVALLRSALPEANFPQLDDSAARAALEAAVGGLVSMAELEATDLSAQLELSLTPDQQRLLRAEAPLQLRLPGGRELTLHYERDRPPWVESRLQDFFGMADGPRVAKGRVPVTLHLLAPNKRAVQVTSDLAGFWERHYPALRRELGRRYPKHSWPEDGRRAAPPPPGRLR